MYALDKNKKGRIGLTTPKWWGKTRRRVEGRVVRECSVSVGSTKVHKQRYVLPKHHPIALKSYPSYSTQELD